MHFKIEPFTKVSMRHTAMIETWWKEHSGIEFQNFDMFSNHGYMIYGNEEAIAAIFLYPILGCRTALIGYPIADLFISKEVRQNALALLMTHVEVEAKDMGYTHLSSYSGSNGSHRLFERCGYSKGDSENIINFIKKVD